MGRFETVNLFQRPAPLGLNEHTFFNRDTALMSFKLNVFTTLIALNTKVFSPWVDQGRHGSMHRMG